MSTPLEPKRLKDDPAVRDAITALREDVPAPDAVARGRARLDEALRAPPGNLRRWIAPLVAGAAVIGAFAGLRHLARTPVPLPAERPTPAASVTSIASPINPPAAAPSPTTTPPAPRHADVPGKLAEELERFKAAKADADAGRHDAALAKLAGILHDDPGTALRPEIDVSIADILVRAGRDPEAAAAIELLLREPAHEGRRAELYRTLGDLRMRQHDCARAVEAWDHSLSLRSSGPEADAARAGRASCGSP